MGAEMTKEGITNPQGGSKLRGADFLPLGLNETVPVQDKHDQLFQLMSRLSLN